MPEDDIQSIPPSAAAGLPPDRSSNPTGQHAPGYGELRRGLISLVIGIGSYYLARYLGETALAALMISTAVLALRVCYTAMRARRFDPIAVFLLAADGVTALVGLVARSPAIIMLGQHIPGVVFEIFVFVGLVRGRPITESMIEWFRPGLVEHHIANHAWTEDDARAYHRIHVRLSLVIAIAQLLHLVAATIIIFTLPVDLAKGLIGVFTLVAVAIILGTALGGIGYFLRRRRSRESEKGPTRPTGL